MKSCPRTVHLREAGTGEEAEGNSFCAPFYNLAPAPHSANLKQIVCNSGVTVPLKLLAVEETKNCGDIELCEKNHVEPPGMQSGLQVCCIPHEQFAHVYVTTELSKPVIKHYIVIFVEGKRIGKYNELVEILFNTAKWLKIESERPRFYIYYFGKQPVFINEIDNARYNITKELRRKLNGCEKGEIICSASIIRRDSTKFFISSSNPYLFKVS
jgi:hypothetical protein